MLAWTPTADPDRPIEVTHVDAPTPAPNEVVVQVEAFSVNRGEAFLMEAPRPGWRPGKDVAGTVVRVAADASGPSEGQRVVEHPPSRGWAEKLPSRSSLPTSTSSQRLHSRWLPRRSTPSSSASSCVFVIPWLIAFPGDLLRPWLDHPPRRHRPRRTARRMGPHSANVRTTSLSPAQAPGGRCHHLLHEDLNLFGLPGRRCLVEHLGDSLSLGPGGDALRHRYELHHQWRSIGPDVVRRAGQRLQRPSADVDGATGAMPGRVRRSAQTS